MYRTDFIVKYRDIENELTKRLEQRMAEEVAAQISSAIQANFNFTNINIVTNINGNPVLTKTITNTNANTNANMNMNTLEDVEEEQEVEKEVEKPVEEEVEKPVEEEVEKPVKKKRGRKSKKQLAAEALEERLALERDRLEKEIEFEKEQMKQKQLQKQKQSQSQSQLVENCVSTCLPCANDTNNTNDISDSDDDEDYKYTRQDIMYICEKLYRDELISVFDAESLEDPKMDAGIKMVFERLIKHDEFSKFLVELSPHVVDNSKAKTEQELFNYKRNSDYLLFITMFSQQLFYLTHQCICKMLVEGHVGDELMNELKSKLITIFSYCKPSA
jgi:hypothetical protein